MQIVEGGDQTLQPIAEVPENGSDSGSYQSQVTPVCCGSMTFWYGSGSAYPCLWLMDPDSDPDPSVFVIDLKFFNTIFSAYDFLKLHLHNFSKIKIQKESQNRRNQGFSYYFCMIIEGSGSRAGSGSGSIHLTSGSGFGSGRPKNFEKHVDPDSDPDPQHCCIGNFSLSFAYDMQYPPANGSVGLCLKKCPKPRIRDGNHDPDPQHYY